MIKVLNIISDTNVGGAGRVILNYLKYRDKEEFAVSVALPKGSLLKERLMEFQVPVYEVNGIADKSLDLKAVKELKKIIKKADPDIVHTHGSMSGRIAGRQCHKKVIYTRHSAFPVSPRIKKGLGRFLNKTVNEHYADRIIAVSPATMENLTDGGISEKLIDVVMNGVEPAARTSGEQCAALKQQIGIQEGEFVAGILARIEDYKGHLYILEAANILKGQGRKFKILVAGTGSFEETVKARAKELGVEDVVCFLGFVTDVPAILSILDVQLNASYGTEATSLSLLEGFSMGVPVIASDYGGNPWLIEEEKNGLLFKSRDSAGLAACMAELMDNPERLQQMGAYAKKLYQEKYTGEVFARNIEDIYRKTLGGAQNG